MDAVPTLKTILFNNVILETLNKHLSMREIILLASTCRIMHKNWVNRKGLHLDRHLKAYFNWETLSIGAFATFRKRILASLDWPGTCIGGCGKLSISQHEAVPRFVHRYTMCQSCFHKGNWSEYMVKHGFMTKEAACTLHRIYLKTIARTKFSDEIVTDFFGYNSSSIAREYRETQIGFNYYYICNAYSSYIKINHTTIEKNAAKDTERLFNDIARYLSERLAESRLEVSAYEVKLNNAKEVRNDRKRMYDEVFGEKE